MFEISLISLIMIYLVVVMSMVGLDWWWSGVRFRARIKREEREKVLCRACGHLFLDRSQAECVLCPHCGRKNERNGGR